jgi:hypothetical protein
MLHFVSTDTNGKLIAEVIEQQVKKKTDKSE